MAEIPQSARLGLVFLTVSILFSLSMMFSVLSEDQEQGSIDRSINVFAMAYGLGTVFTIFSIYRG